jgi:hypothetical protein
LKDQNQDHEANLAERRQTVDNSVHRQIEHFEKAIGGLKKIDRLQFEQLIVDALLWCAMMHADSSRRRLSEVRKDLLRVKEEAAAAEKHLVRLHDALAKLEPTYRERLDGCLDLLSNIAGLIEKRPPWFYALSNVSSTANFCAELLREKDNGGAPKMIAFGALIRGLQRAFEKATGRRAAVTWHEHREQFQGKFLDLAEAVLPLALALACHSERPLRHPQSVQARGKYIHKVTKRKRPQRGDHNVQNLKQIS